MWSPWSASILGSSEGMTLQSCPELGQRCQIFTPLMHQSLDVATLGRSESLEEALSAAEVTLSPKGQQLSQQRWPPVLMGSEWHITASTISELAQRARGEGGEAFSRPPLPCPAHPCVL